MPKFEVTEATIDQLQSALANGRVTSVQLVEAYAARIAAYDANGVGLNSILRMNPRARAEAVMLDAERAKGTVRGPLHGVPVVVKDNYATSDLPTTAGSLALANLQTPRDAYIVSRLRAAGAIIIAKTNLSEFASGITTISSMGGQTRNPYDPQRCPGGSSGGTGVAVAASFAAIGWGSDTCGSIRIPSTFNSLVGLRPTVGLYSRAGIVPRSHTQDVGGPMGRTARDVAIAMDLTVGVDTADTTTLALKTRATPRFVDALDTAALRGARFGLLGNYMKGIDGEISDSIKSTVKGLKARGAEVVDVTIADLDSLLARSAVLDLEVKLDVDGYLAQQPNAPRKTWHDVLLSGLFTEAQEKRFRTFDTVTTYDNAGHREGMTRQATLRARLIALMDSLKLDAIIYPSMTQRPALIGDPQPGGTCALSANTGLPALTAPAGFMAEELPIGLEFLGRPFADAKLVAYAYAMESQTPRRRAPATTPPLISGRAPFPAIATTSARAAAAVARATFTYDRVRNELSWRVTVDAAGAPDRIQAVVLRRFDDKGSRVVRRLVGPGNVRGDGSAFIGGLERNALLEGRLGLTIVTSDAESKADEGRIMLPH